MSSIIRWGFVCDDTPGDLTKTGEVACSNLGSDFVSATSGAEQTSGK